MLIKPRTGAFLAPLAAAATLLLSGPAATAASLNEGFDGGLPSDWSRVNRSENPVANWSLGNSGAPYSFGAQTPGPISGINAYAAASYAATGNDVGTISNWLITPTMTFNNGDRLSFFTRTVSADDVFSPDRLQVRFSSVGGTNVGSSETSVGDFTTLLLDINPGYKLDGFPTDWQQYTVTFSGLSGPTTGAVGFRYFVENGGTFGSNSDYIGLDTVQIAAVPEPSAYALAGIGLLALGALSRRRSAAAAVR